MTQVLHQYYRSSLAAAAELTDEEIKKQRWRKHIAEITKNLAPPQSEDLTYEQKQWLRGWQDRFPNHTDHSLQSRYRTSGLIQRTQRHDR